MCMGGAPVGLQKVGPLPEGERLRLMARTHVSAARRGSFPHAAAGSALPVWRDCGLLATMWGRAEAGRGASTTVGTHTPLSLGRKRPPAQAKCILIIRGSTGERRVQRFPCVFGGGGREGGRDTPHAPPQAFN